jgi:putative permease
MNPCFPTHSIGFSCGLRLSEGTHLKVEDIDGDRGFILMHWRRWLITRKVFVIRDPATAWNNSPTWTKMIRILREWQHRYLSDPQAVILFFFLFLGVVIVYTLGRILAPVLAAVVIAYTLEGLVTSLIRLRIPRPVAVLLVFLTFMFSLLVLLFILLPMLSRQLGQLVSDLPLMFSYIQSELMLLPEKYPGIISEDQASAIIRALTSEMADIGQQILTFSLASVWGAITFLIYVIVVPFLVFYFLKDKDEILGWLPEFVPERHALSEQVWQVVDRQMGRYIRGKLLEILIVWGGSTLLFHVLGLQFAMLNGFIVGVSVLVPYVGAIAAFLPVALTAYFQWGSSSGTLYLMTGYWIIQFLDGYVLAVLLLSGVVNLHPATTLISFVLFGGLWGFWGVLFAIPLATLIQALIQAWPRVGPLQNAAPRSGEPTDQRANSVPPNMRS